MKTFLPMNYWIKWKDIERCPYTWREPEFYSWCEKDDERLFLIALDRYADYLKERRKDASS